MCMRSRTKLTRARIKNSRNSTWLQTRILNSTTNEGGRILWNCFWRFVCVFGFLGNALKVPVRTSFAIHSHELCIHWGLEFWGENECELMNAMSRSVLTGTFRAFPRKPKAHVPPGRQKHENFIELSHLHFCLHCVEFREARMNSWNFWLARVLCPVQCSTCIGL